MLMLVDAEVPGAPTNLELAVQLLKLLLELWIEFGHGGRLAMQPLEVEDCGLGTGNLEATGSQAGGASKRSRDVRYGNQVFEVRPGQAGGRQFACFSGSGLVLAAGATQHVQVQPLDQGGEPLPWFGWFIR